MLIEGIIKFIRSMPKLKGTSDAIFYDDGTFMLGQYKCRIQNGKIKEVECANIIGQQVCELPQPDLSSMLHPSLLPKDAQDLQQNKCWYMPESYNKLIAECQENHENDAKTEQYVKSKKSIDQMNSECNRRIKEKEACSMDFSDWIWLYHCWNKSISITNRRKCYSYWRCTGEKRILANREFGDHR